MNTTVTLTDGQRAEITTGQLLWSHAGERGTAEVTPAGVLVSVIGGESYVPVATWGQGEGGWAPAGPCDYCARPATYTTRDMPECAEFLCQPCARQQFDTPRDWVKPLTMAAIRYAYKVHYC